MGKRNTLSISKKQSIIGWLFLAPALLELLIFLFFPMVRGFVISLNSNKGAFANYARIFRDATFKQAIRNTLYYVLIELVLMLPLALLMAAVLQQKNLKFKGLYRVLLFVPCTMALMSYATVFKVMFGTSGIINSMLVNAGILEKAYPFLTTAAGARLVITICLLWRWSGYNMVFYCTGFSNIDPELYEAAEIDGATPVKKFFHITVPLLRPIILLTIITTTNGTLQILDEIYQLTGGGPANSTISISQYIYSTAFAGKPQFPYASAMSFVLFAAIALLTALQMKVGDENE